MVVEGLLDAAGGGGSDALVDRQCLPQAGGAFAGVAVLEVAAADSFQGTCFLKGSMEFAGDGQRLVVVVAGLMTGCGPG
jgi:hypothetical protein